MMPRRYICSATTTQQQKVITFIRNIYFDFTIWFDIFFLCRPDNASFLFLIFNLNHFAIPFHHCIALHFIQRFFFFNFRYCFDSLILHRLREILDLSPRIWMVSTRQCNCSTHHTHTLADYFIYCLCYTCLITFLSFFFIFRFRCTICLGFQIACRFDKIMLTFIFYPIDWLNVLFFEEKSSDQSIWTLMASSSKLFKLVFQIVDQISFIFFSFCIQSIKALIQRFKLLSIHKPTWEM